MTTLTITLPEEHLLRLREKARRLGITPEDLVRFGIAELLGRPDEDLQNIVDYVLAKNADLYRRLAAS